jgi:hypothetical protein
MTLRFRAISRGGLRGFAPLELASGLIIVDCPVFVIKSRLWVALPRKPVLDEAGRRKVSAAGKPAFQPILKWRDGDLADHFSAAVVELVRAAHPDALNGVGR